MKRVFLFVNGIRTWPGADKNWTGRATTATMVHTDHAAEKVEYFSLALTRGINNRRRARKLATVLDYYNGWERIVVAHSNGADVVRDALKQELRNIAHLHLISPAIPSDCEKNGLNELCERENGGIHRLSLWIGLKDVPLRLAKLLPARWMGYGSLGLDSIHNASPALLGKMHEIVVEPEFGHSTWFEERHFNDTMYRIWSTPR